jgi:hypothetical protein
MIDALVLDFEQTESGADLLATDLHLGPRVDLLPLYDLERTELVRYRGLLIGLHADQRYLQTRRAQLEAFLGAGRVVVVCGHIARPFLAELALFQPIPDYTVADLQVQREHDHPVWDGVRTEDLTWRRGVAGFYGRGGNPPPAGATIIHTLGPSRCPVDFECRPAVGGRLLVHAGVDLWGFISSDTSAKRIVPQLLDWIAATAEVSRP